MPSTDSTEAGCHVCAGLLPFTAVFHGDTYGDQVWGAVGRQDKSRWCGDQMVQQGGLTSPAPEPPVHWGRTVQNHCHRHRAKPGLPVTPDFRAQVLTFFGDDPVPCQSLLVKVLPPPGHGRKKRWMTGRWVDTKKISPQKTQGLRHNAVGGHALYTL